MEGRGPKPWQASHSRELSGRGWRAFGETRTGSQRTSNEDNYLLAPLAHDRLLVAVADGLGGHNAGQIASRLACETLYDAARDGSLDLSEDSDQSILHSLESIILDAHQRIAMWSSDIEAFRGMGCTLTAGIVAANRAWYCHVGDSRLYQLTRSAWRQITQDHSVETSRRGHGIATSPGQSRYHDAPLAQALGIDESGDRLQLQHGAVALHDGDVLLLCSDGLHRSLAGQHLATGVESDGELAARVHRLVEAAVVAGEGDDITAVLVAVAAAYRAQ